MKICKDEYCIRTLTYYQEKGGVYNGLITALTKLRKQERGLPPIASVLNEACYRFDVIKQNLQNVELAFDDVCHTEDSCLRYTMAVFFQYLPEASEIVRKGIAQFEKTDRRYYPFFRELFIPAELETVKEHEGEAFYKEQIEDLQEELSVAKIQLTEAHSRIEEQEKAIVTFRTDDTSRLDKMLTLRYILDYAVSRRQYSLADQILGMLKGDVSRLATDEEYEEIKRVEQILLDASVPKIENHNEINNSQVFTGLVDHPNFPIGVTPEEFIKKVIAQLNSPNNDKRE